MARMEMTWDEVKRRMKNGATVKTIAELNGVAEQTVYNFIKKNKEAETGIPEYFMEGADKSPKLIVDKDVIEEIENICTRIDNAISEHEVKIIELKDKRKQFEQIINSLEVKS